MITPPKDGKKGRVLIPHTCTIGEIVSAIRAIGYLPSNHNEIHSEDAVDSPSWLVAIGSTVPHPERKHSVVQAYKGYDKKGKIVHVLTSEGSLQTNFEVSIKEDPTKKGDRGAWAA